MTAQARRLGSASALALALMLGCGAADDRGQRAEARQAGAPAASGAAKARTVTLRHRASRFRIRAPRGFKLRARKGVYILKKGAQTMSFSRAVTTVTPTQFGSALLGQLGGRVVARRGGARQFVAQVDRGAERETLVVTRTGSMLAVTTSTSPLSRPASLRTVRAVGASAEGGFALKPRGGGGAPAAIPLQPYRTPDGGATAQVPVGWDVTGGGGSIQGSSGRGAFVFGLSMNIFLPETAPPGTPSGIRVSPYLTAPDALARIFPMLNPAISDIRIRTVVDEAPLPTFSSSGMYLFDYRVDGKPWTGAATIATDSPDRYSNYVWNLYYSGIGVPAGSNGSVGAALLRSWRSWDPSGAIAQRTARAKELISETNAIWQQTSEFRSQTADRQSRDVGCLLLGYYDVEDNSRQYDLPPLPCGRQYVPGS